MQTRWLLMMGVVLLLVGCNQGADNAAKTAESAPDYAKAAEVITADKILEGVNVLAHDDMEGRGTGDAGEQKAAQWIADRYKASGLKPMGEDYLQPVELVGYKKADGTNLTLTGPKGEIAYENEKTLTYWSTAQKPELSVANAPLLFVGYGVEAPEHNWDDYKGVDCKGKILVFLNNDPQTGKADEFGGDSRTYYGRYHYKFEQAMARGAAGAIMIHTTPSAGYGWGVIGNSGKRESFALNLKGVGYQLDVLAWMHQDLAEQLAATVGDTLAGWEAKGVSRDFQPVELPVSLSCTIKTELRETKAHNVVGVWEGSDPTLKDEYLVFSAHFDHLGKKDGEGDTIYNGAWDNALGTSAIIEIADAFSKSGLRPKRSIAFLACTAEEKGLLGSKWFVAKPPVPLNKIVANFNIDMPQIFGATKDIVAIGFDANSMGDDLVKLAGEKQIEIKGDQNPNAGSFYRSDQVNFAKAGIPALYLLPGKDYVNGPTTDVDKYHDEYYHKLQDEVNEFWDLAGCERDMRVAMELAGRIADAPQQPRWHAGNEFEEAWKKLFGRP